MKVRLPSFTMVNKVPVNYSILLSLLDEIDSFAKICKKNGNLYWGENYNQKILPLVESDIELLDSSCLNTIPHETFRVNFHLKNGNVIYGNIYHGDIFNAGTIGEFKKIINNQLRLSNIKLFDVSSLELAHTHPSIEYIETMKDKCRLSLSPLGDSDISIAHNLKYIYGKSVILKAITPSKISYSINLVN